MAGLLNSSHGDAVDMPDEMRDATTSAGPMPLLPPNRAALFRIARPTILMLLFAAACGTDVSEARFRSHPTEENAFPPDAIALTDDPEPPGLAGERLDRWMAARERLRGARTVATVGSTEEGSELFGEVADAKVDEVGNLVVLDEQAAAVRVFGPGGTYLHGFGREGEGPLEVIQPLGLELLGADRLTVYYGLQAKVFSRPPGRVAA